MGVFKYIWGTTLTERLFCIAAVVIVAAVWTLIDHYKE